MTNFIEIGGLIKKGLGHSVVERFSKNIDVVSIGFANGRSSDLFDIQQFGDASEAEILTIIVKARKSNSIFDELYIGRVEINTNGGNKRRSLYFQADYIFKE